jgi:hypothetical protein
VTFRRLRSAALAFDQRVRRGITAEDIANLEDVLGRLERNVTGSN